MFRINLKLAQRLVLPQPSLRSPFGGWGRGGEFVEHALRPPSSSDLPVGTRTASGGNGHGEFHYQGGIITMPVNLKNAVNFLIH